MSFLPVALLPSAGSCLRGTSLTLHAQKKDGINNSTSEGRLFGSPGWVQEIVAMGEVTLDK